MKILALTYNFKPDTSPTAYCLEVLVEKLSDKHEITILTSLPQDKSISYNADHDNYKVLRYIDPLAYFNYAIRQKLSDSKGVEKIFWAVSKFFSSFVNRCNYFFYPDGGYFWQRYVFKKITRDIDLEEYEAIIASIGLYSTQKLAVKLKKLNPSLKIVTYLNDPLPIDNPFIINTKHIFNEKTISESSISTSDTILANDIIYNKYANGIFNDNKFKFINVDIPLLKQFPTNSNDFNYNGDQNSLKILFAGSLYKEIRNPERAISSILQISDMKISIHLIGNINDCAEVIYKLSKKFPDRIFTYGTIERELLYCAMEKADYLLNIGNDLEGQVPSKIFEYMSSGKPIIHYYTKEHDTSIKYLKKFKHVYMYNLNGDDTIQTKELFHFLHENKNLKVPYHTVKKILYANTPEYVAEQVHNVLLKLEVK